MELIVKSPDFSQSYNFKHFPNKMVYSEGFRTFVAHKFIFYTQIVLLQGLGTRHHLGASYIYLHVNVQVQACTPFLHGSFQKTEQDGS